MYKLINQQTGEQTICNKVTIDGFDYYVSDEKFKDLKSDSNYLGFVFNHLTNGQFFICNKINELINEKYQTIWNNSDYRHYSQWYLSNFIKSGSWEIHKVIATNNPNIDIPQVVDEVDQLAKEATNKQLIRIFGNESKEEILDDIQKRKFYFIKGYNKSQETHSFSEEDMIEFAKWLDDNMQQREYYPMSSMNHKELLQLWKEQKPKKVYYTQTIDK